MKQILSYFFTLLLWIVVIILTINGTTPWLFIALLCLHFIELIVIGLRIGRQNGKGIKTSIVMCMLFGFFWWLPMKKQMNEDDLTDQDFIEDGKEPWREPF